MVTFFILQARDVSRAAGETASVARPRGEIADPTTLSEPELWAALATGPITSEAVEARNAQWDTVRSSIRLGWLTLRSGGELDSGYDRVGVAMRPLGLDLQERPPPRSPDRQ